MGAPSRAHELLDELFDVLKTSQDDWVDQTESPLGRVRHCVLARPDKKKKKPAVLQSRKDGRRILIRRSVIDAYLASKQRVFKKTEEQTEERDVENAMRLIQGGR